MRRCNLLRISLVSLGIVGMGLAVGASVASGQALSEIKPSPVENGQAPDWVTYNFFFRHLAALDSVADKRDAIGKKEDAVAWRTYEQRSARISAEEAAILKQVAYECNDAVNAQDTRLQSVSAAVAAARRQKSQTGLSLQAAGSSETAQLWDQRTQIINDHIDLLRSRLGIEAFGKLDRYIRVTFQAGAVLVPTSTLQPEGEKAASTPLGLSGFSGFLSYIYVAAAAREISPGQGYGACETQMTDTTTLDDYPGVNSICQFNHFGSQFNEVQCSDRVAALCSGEFSTAPGDTYSILGEHGLYLYSGSDYPESGCGSNYWDAQHFSTNVGVDLQCCSGDSGYVFSQGDAICISIQDALLAFTHSSFVAASNTVTISPLGQEVLPSQAQVFTATVIPSTLAQTFTWSMVSGVGVIESATGKYTAPANETLAGEASATVQACSTAIPSACASTTFPVPKITISVTGSPLLATPGATETLFANVTGPQEALDLTWTPPTSVVSLSLASAQYTVPDNGITETTKVPITACWKKVPTVCNSPAFQLELVPLIKIGFVNPIQWPAGTHAPLGLLPVTISGTGFGLSPTVSLSDKGITFSQVASATPNTQILGYASIPLMAQETVTLTVTSATDGISPPPAGVSIVISPPITSVVLSPKPTSLQERQPQPFTALLTCTVSGANKCQETPQVTWSALGTLVPSIAPNGQVSAQYTAPVGVASDTVKICAIWAPTVAACDSATFTVIPPTVTMVPPTSVNLAGCGSNKFSAQVTNAQATTVNWSISPIVGSIDAQGLYAAPCPYTAASPTTVTVKATSTIDAARFGLATVTVTPVFSVGSVSPVSGPMAGGTTVTIVGSGFSSGATVSIGGSPATSVTVISGAQITAVTPSHACGPVDLVVTAGGQSKTLTGGFVYTSPQPPAGLSPNGTIFPSTTTSVTLTWAATPGAVQYAVRVQDNTDGTIRDPRNNCPTSTLDLCVNGVPTTTYSVPVRSGHNYTWWVQSGSSCGQYSVQTNGTFSVANPTHVTAISPGSGPMAGGTLVTITGTDFRSGATVMVGGAAATGVTVVSATQIMATSSAHACGTVDVVVTDPGDAGGTLAGGFFYTSPQPPTGLSPIGTAFPSSTTAVTLSWSAVSGATQYAVRVQDNTDGTLRNPGNSCPTNTLYVCVDGRPTTTFSVPVQAGHNYSWWVHAGSSCGQYSLQTNGSFSVAVALPAPTVSAINPPNGAMAGGTPVSITGTGFRAGAAVSLGGVAATGVTVVNATTITATTGAHACGTVNLVVTNTDGRIGTLANGFFYTSPQPPTGLSPNGTVFASTATSVALTWAPTSGATQYAVRVQDNTDGTIRDPRNNCPTNTIDLCVNGVPSTSYSVPVQAGHSYTWWVQSGSSCGQYSLQTNASFSVAAMVVPQSPTGLSPNGAVLAGTTTSVTMSWNATAGATKYAVRLQDNTDGTIRDPRNNCPTNTIDLCVNDIVSTSYSAPVISGHSYTWWVHAGNAAGYSLQTNASFSVAVDPLHAPTGLSKDAASRNLLWNPPNNLTGADAVTYDLRITGGANCSAGCLYHPGAPSWYTMGAEIGTGTYTWTLKANSASRPSSAAVSGPSFTMP